VGPGATIREDPFGLHAAKHSTRSERLTATSPIWHHRQSNGARKTPDPFPCPPPAPSSRATSRGSWWIADPHISPERTAGAFVGTTALRTGTILSSVWMVDHRGRGSPRQFHQRPPSVTPRPLCVARRQRALAFLSEREVQVRRRQLYGHCVPDGLGEPTRTTTEETAGPTPAWVARRHAVSHFLSRVGGWQEPESDEEKQKVQSRAAVNHHSQIPVPKRRGLDLLDSPATTSS